MAYNEAQVKSPELAEPYYNAANALYRQGNYEEALKQLQKALQLWPERRAGGERPLQRRQRSLQR